MCTVTYIPVNNSFFLTSNRDEKKVRLKAEQPQWYKFASGHLLFPKDGNAGGTWMALHENGNAMVLLNGSTVNHQYAPPYRKSRGLIFLDILSEGKALVAFKKINLLGIEPFTLVIWESGQLHECRWSGEEKYIREMDATQPHIWSSVTLYTSEIIHKREQWFADWLKKHPTPASNDILQFHLFGGDGDAENDIRMNRNNSMYTVSVTNIDWDRKSANILYEDIIHQEKHFSSISFVQEQPVS